MRLTPFLLRFKQVCLSPNRMPQDDEYVYDEEVDMVRWMGIPDRPLAIETSMGRGPTTKKRDMEKGDDSKDWRMWK